MPAWQFVNFGTIGTNQGPGNRADLLAFLNPVLYHFRDQKQKVLDVGCNAAWFAHVFDNYFGIDTDLNSIQVAQHFWTREGRWTHILRDVLEHVADASQLLKLAVSRLKPGGWIFISAPDAQRWMWNDPTHVRPLPLQAQKWLAQSLGAEVIRQGYESVAPGTQKIARLFRGRSPFLIRLLTHLRCWPRNCLSLIRLSS